MLPAGVKVNATLCTTYHLLIAVLIPDGFCSVIPDDRTNLRPETIELCSLTPIMIPS
jgi:hypothetical protein